MTVQEKLSDGRLAELGQWAEVQKPDVIIGSVELKMLVDELDGLRACIRSGVLINRADRRLRRTIPWAEYRTGEDAGYFAVGEEAVRQFNEMKANLREHGCVLGSCASGGRKVTVINA